MTFNVVIVGKRLVCQLARVSTCNYTKFRIQFIFEFEQADCFERERVNFHVPSHIANGKKAPIDHLHVDVEIITQHVRQNTRILSDRWRRLCSSKSSKRRYFFGGHIQIIGLNKLVGKGHRVALSVYTPLADVRHHVEQILERETTVTLEFAKP